MHWTPRSKLSCAALRRLKKKLHLEGDVTVSDVLRLPGLFTGRESGANPEKDWPSLKKVLQRTVQQAIKDPKGVFAKLSS